MKLSHLSIAIFSAIALAACGGSSSSKSPTEDTPPPPPPKPKPVVPVTPNASADKIVDPTQTGVVGDLDYNTQPSQGTTQYIRGKKSKFDRVDNPTDKTSSTSILGVDLKEQNPQLSNIVLARLPDPSNGNVYVQLAGNMPEDSANIWKETSLQRQNELNVDLLVPASKDASLNKPNVNYYKNRVKQLTDLRDFYETKLISDPAWFADKNKANQHIAQLRSLISIMESLEETIQNDPEYGQNVAPLPHNDYTLKWGDGIRTEDALGPNGVLNTASGPEANGLVAMNYQKYNEQTKLDRVSVQGTEEKSQSSTRIFGRNFDTNDAVTLGKGYASVMNSYLGAGAYLYDEAGASIDSIINIATGKATFDGSHMFDSNQVNGLADVSDLMDGFDEWLKAAYGNATTNYLPGTSSKLAIGYTLGAVPMNLSKVQYGRVSANLDPPNITTVAKPLDFNRQNFLTKGNDRAVDTYFYRGVDATTLTQMEALKDKKLNYNGHALMYGVRNDFIGELGGNVPNAVGAGGRHGIGNFVSAEVDLSDNSIVGGIYNVWQHGYNDADPIPDVIVKFAGKIHGNTALGEAERVYKEGKADFRASFFGPNAEELGGSINSTTYQDQYGPKDGKDVWGGVFGAKNVAGGLSNKWLGDIPKVK